MHDWCFLKGMVFRKTPFLRVQARLLKAPYCRDGFAREGLPNSMGVVGLCWTLFNVTPP